MNGAMYIILIPAVLVAAGYIVVLRMLGMSPGYLRLFLAAGVFFGALYWLSKRGKKATPSSP